MRKTVLFGAGQTGAMICRLMGAQQRVMCFAENSPEKCGGELMGVPVLTLRESLLLEPELVCLCALGADRADAMERQLCELGYTGATVRADILKTFDARAATLRLLAERINASGVAGDAAELGVYRGEFAALINAAFPQRTLHLYDTFQGFADDDVQIERARGFSRAQAGDFSATTAELVKSRLPFPEKAVLHIGYFPDTFEPDAHFAFVSIDADLYVPTAAALPLFWDRLTPGGALLVHDVNSAQYGGAGEAVREFCAAHSLLPMPVCDLHGSVVLQKSIAR